MAEASRRGRLLESEPDKPLPDVPLHKRGFGVHGPAMSELDADDAALEACWLPIVGLCITIPVWLWLRLTRNRPRRPR
jgi:hypothetical protein